MSLFADILLVASIITFFIGFASTVIKQIRIKGKIRYYFIASIFLFTSGLIFGWEDFKAGFNDCRVDTNQIETKVPENGVMAASNSCCCCEN